MAQMYACLNFFHASAMRPGVFTVHKVFASDFCTQDHVHPDTAAQPEAPSGTPISHESTHVQGVVGVSGGRGAAWKPEARRATGWARGGIPTTLAFCGASIAFGFVMFSIKWHQHEIMYPRQPRGFKTTRAQQPLLLNDAPKDA